MLSIVLVLAAIGDLLGTVNLPGNGGCSVAGTFDGVYYMTINTNGCSGTIIGVYQPPVGGNGSATLVASKNIVDASNNSVTISALAWDAGRGKVWGAFGGNIYLIDIGNATVNGSGVATLQFSPGFGGLVDGLAYDPSDDTIYYTPDVSCQIHHYNATNGTLLNTVTPKNAANVSDCSVSGVVVGTNNTLYIGRNGAAEIRRIDKTTGNFISQFATTSGRVEGLTCDPVTYAPKEAILAKDAYNSLYEAFEVQAGTCPLQGDDIPPELGCIETVNPHGNKVPPAGKTTLPGSREGDNEDGFYELFGEDNSDPSVDIFVTDSSGSGPFGPFASGDKVKISEAPGSNPSSKTMGSSNGQAGAIIAHITLKGDAIITATDSAGNTASVSCLVPPLPK